MAATELPWDLGVAGVIEPGDLEILIEADRPPIAAFEVEMPIDLITEADSSGAKVVHSMGQDRLRLVAQCGGRVVQLGRE